ncbi:MAG: hypothetical protein LC632_00595, partial [Xanthomonadaceae bacterium]|nr:hypothetical protein [Xanthomonadaceae bacterium]
FTGSYICRVRAYNLFRRVTFFNSLTYIDQCRKWSIPVLLTDRFTFPWISKKWFKLGSLQEMTSFLDIVIELLESLGVERASVGAVLTDLSSEAVSVDKAKSKDRPPD